MKKLILGVGLLAFSLSFWSPTSSIAQIMCDVSCEEPKYYKLAQVGPTTYCCVASTNSLDTCSGVPC